MQCVERTVEEHYRSRGRLVRIGIDTTESEVNGLELRSAGEWSPLAKVDAPPPWLLQRAVDHFRECRAASETLRFDRARAVSAHDDHVTLELQGEIEPGLRGQLAVLPRSQMAPRDAGWESGASTRFVALRRHYREQIDGGEPWRDASVRWLASRVEKRLPKLLIRHYFAIEVETVVSNGICMAIVPTAGDDYARLVGKQGDYIRRLCDILGLDRVCVARMPASHEPFARLTSAVARVTGLKRREFVVKMARQSSDLPAVLTERRLMPRLVGRGGAHLLFIRRLSGVPFTYAERIAPMRAAA